jgi:hypothetical protein
MDHNSILSQTHDAGLLIAKSLLILRPPVYLGLPDTLVVDGKPQLLPGWNL